MVLNSQLLDAAEQALFEIQESIDTNTIKHINPTNFLEEKKRFFDALQNDMPYNPRFSYLANNPVYSFFSLSPEFEQLKKKILAVQTDDSALGRLLEKKKLDILNEINLVRSIGKQEFTENSVKHFGLPSKKTISFAKEILDNKAIEKKKNKPACSIKKFLEEYLQSRGLEAVVQLAGNMSSDVSINPKNRVISIRQSACFSEKDFKRLALHEIETHYLRYLNGLQQDCRFFSTGFSNQCVATEEGLAAVNEERFNVLDEETLRKYAGRAIAVDYAMEHSFFETFKVLENYFPCDEAYFITQRVKRGISNTEKKGAFTKDFAYLEGMLKVKDFLSEGGKIEELYFGKIAVEEAEQVRGIQGLKQPMFAPTTIF